MDKISLSRQVLYELVWQNPMLSLSQKYAISNVGLKKACARMNIPVPRTGHWQKLKFGKKSKKISLPQNDKVEQTLSLSLRTDGSKSGTDPMSPMKILQLEIEDELQDKLKVPDRLTNPDRLVAAARESLNTKTNYSRYKDVVHTTDYNLDIRVSPQHVGRSLRFMDTLIKCSRLRGHIIDSNYRGAKINFRDVSYKISFREKMKKVVLNENRWDNIQYHPTGVLYFKLDGYGGRDFFDGKTKLEDQISKILAKLEMEVAGLNATWKVNRKREEIRKEEERIRQEYEQKKQDELLSFKRLIKEAHRWREVKRLREYLAGRSAEAQDNNTNTEEFSQWLEWANHKVDWYDPSINAEDELLKDVDKDELVFIKPPPKPVGFFS